MKQIKLTNSSDNVIIDDSNYERLSKFSWRVVGNGSIFRFTNKGLKKTVGISLASEIFCTREIMYDHKDRNFLNNLESNLRPCTYSQNSFNRTKYKDKKYSSEFKGVYWKVAIKKWIAATKFLGKTIHIGTFASELEAAHAYNVRVVTLCKEFLVLNKDAEGNII